MLRFRLAGQEINEKEVFWKTQIDEYENFLLKISDKPDKDFIPIFYFYKNGGIGRYTHIHEDDRIRLTEMGFKLDDKNKVVVE